MPANTCVYCGQTPAPHPITRQSMLAVATGLKLDSAFICQDCYDASLRADGIARDRNRREFMSCSIEDYGELFRTERFGGAETKWQIVPISAAQSVDDDEALDEDDSDDPSGGAYSPEVRKLLDSILHGSDDSLQRLRKMALGGSAEAQWALARLYEPESDYCLRPDVHEAMRWYKMVAEGDHSLAAYALLNLADSYLHPDSGIPTNEPLGFELTRKAALKGYDRAAYNLGVMYEQGIGTAVNNEEAVKWYAAAAESGLPEALNNLGTMYRDGTGVRQDFETARRLFEQAAASGDEDAEMNLQTLATFQKGLPSFLRQKRT